MRYDSALRVLAVGLCVYFTLILICIFIRPESLTINAGISYFIFHGNTINLYIAATLVLSLTTLLASLSISQSDFNSRVIRYSLQIFSLLFLLIILTPSTDLIPEHLIFGTVLFILQLILGMVMLLRFKTDWKDALLFSITVISAVVTSTYLHHSQGYIIEAQIVFQAAFWFMFYRILLKSE